MKLQAGGFWTCNLVNSAKSWQTAQKKKKRTKKHRNKKQKQKRGEDRGNHSAALVWSTIMVVYGSLPHISFSVNQRCAVSFQLDYPGLRKEDGCVCVCGACCPLSTCRAHVLWLSDQGLSLLDVQTSQSNQSLLLWLLLRTVWPFCTCPFLDFSLRSQSPSSSSDSVSSLSLLSSSTMSWWAKNKNHKKQKMRRGKILQLVVWGDCVTRPV